MENHLTYEPAPTSKKIKLIILCLYAGWGPCPLRTDYCLRSLTLQKNAAGNSYFIKFPHGDGKTQFIISAQSLNYTQSRDTIKDGPRILAQVGFKGLSFDKKNDFVIINLGADKSQIFDLKKPQLELQNNPKIKRVDNAWFREILKIIKKFIQERGRPPTRPELARAVITETGYQNSQEIYKLIAAGLGKFWTIRQNGYVSNFPKRPQTFYYPLLSKES